MKAIVKFAAASFLALSAIAPALAAEEDTLLERSGGIVTFQASHHANMRSHRGVDAYASVGAVRANPYDFGIKDQGN